MFRVATALLLASFAIPAAALPGSRPLSARATAWPNARPAQAATQPQVVLATGFEAGSFTAGQPLDGQDGWITIAGRDAIVVSDTDAHRGHQCVKILGDQLVPTTRYFLEAFAGRYLNFDPVAAGKPLVHLRTSARLDGPDTGDGPKDSTVSANFYVATTAGENLGAFYVSSDGYVYGSPGGGPYYLYAVPYHLGSYVDLDLVLDFTARTTTFVVDGQSIGTAPIYPHPLTSTELVAAALELNIYHNKVKPDQRALYTAYFDDYAVTAQAD